MAVIGYLSGVESGTHFGHCVSAGVRHVLMSYWQFYKHDLGLVAARKKANPNMRFMIDSGAHTFITEAQKFAHWKRKDFEDYVEGYARWLEKNRQHIHLAVELDIDHTLNVVLGGSTNSTIGTSIVEGWQKTYFRPLVEKGLEIIFVWHENRGMDGWEDMCRRYAYVGMPGHYSNEPDKINRHFSVARRYLTKVHGFAATKQLDFRDVPWCSVDSITWKTGEMYGQLIIWDKFQQKLIFEDDKTQRHKYRSIIQDAGFDADAIIADANYKEVTRFGLWSMRSMEEFYWKLYSDRTPYFAVRLPHHNALARKTPAEIASLWKDLRGDVVFKQHAACSITDKLNGLIAVSAAQYGDLSAVSSSQPSQAFLGSYFPKLITPLVTDATVLQKEIASFVIPPNPPPLPRTALEHYTSSPIKLREDDIAIDDLEFRPFLGDL